MCSLRFSGSEEHLMGPSMSRAFHHIVQIMTLGLIVATVNMDNIVASDTIDAFVIPFDALMMLMLVMWRKKNSFFYCQCTSSYVVLR
jgi:hypothetical protein